MWIQFTDRQFRRMDKTRLCPAVEARGTPSAPRATCIYRLARPGKHLCTALPDQVPAPGKQAHDCWLVKAALRSCISERVAGIL